MTNDIDYRKTPTESISPSAGRFFDNILIGKTGQNPTNCVNCGAPLHNDVCEYCGTEY